MRAAHATNSQGSSDEHKDLSPRPSTSSCFNDLPPLNDPTGNIPKNLFDLSDEVIVNILRTLPEEDAYRAAKASWRLHMLVLLHAPGSHLRIDARLTSEHARGLLRKTPQLKSLELRYRADTDLLLNETALNCPELQTLTLVGCRGDVSTRTLTRMPLLALAKKCRELRVLYLRLTSMRSVGAIKVWCDNRGPGTPTLIIRLDSLKPKQIEQLQRLQEVPSPKSDFDIHPCVFRVSNHQLHLCLETPTSSTNCQPIVGNCQPSTDSTVSTLTAEESDTVDADPPTFASEIPLPTPSINESWFTSGFIGNVTESPPSEYLEQTPFSSTDLLTDSAFR